MPSRTTCLAILVCWALATFALVRRDILPELLIGPPPNLNSMSSAGASDKPTEWVIQVADPKERDSFRSVGRATTSTERQPNDWTALKSLVTFDSGDLLKSTPFGLGQGMKLVIENTLRIDPTGNPRELKAVLREQSVEQPFIELNGVFQNHKLDISTRGAAPGMNRVVSFPYEPKSMVQNAFSPIDRLPGLQVGQRWESKVVSPFTGKADVVRVEVERQAEIFWDQGLVKTFVVVQRMAPMAARTWVRPDGLVLRQEVPLPFVKLVLERQP